MIKTTLRSTAAIATLGMVFALGGCNSTPKTASSQPAMGMINDTCPMMGTEVPADGPTVMYKGQTIGFCCADCVPAWNKLSDAKKAEKVAAMKK